MRQLFVLVFLLSTLPGFAQKSKKTAKADRAPKQERVEQTIREIMKAQEVAWNRGDLEGFMDSYWQSDSLKFIGARGITYGWQQTLNNYKKAYPDRDAMGKLTFTIYSIEKPCMKNAFVTGKYHLARRSGDLSGYYTLWWRKIKGKWVIVADHSG